MGRKARHKQHGNSHAAAPGRQGATSVLPPFSEKLRVDKSLKLSHGDFKQKLDKFYENKQLSATDQLTATPAFPSPHVLAQFADMAYADYQREEPLNGWKLLTTASHFGASNGYFGTAYWHPEHQHVVIAHRGTDSVGAFVTDVKGVVFNKYVNQMRSASTLANKVVEVLQEIEKEKGVSFELFFTGHSLGGWLAQITTFTTKYLEEKDGTFLNRRKAQEHEPLGGGNVEDSHGVRESYHPHAVVFDSPGCKDMLSQMADKLDVRLKGHSIDLQQLDITSYLSAPNRINTCNSHLGTVYRIFPDLSDMDCFSKHTPLHNLATHKMDKIVGAFDPETGQALKDDKSERKIREVVDWPISAGLTGGKEYNEFFKWAQHLNEYHPEENVSLFNKVPAGYHPLRYQTKAYDECSKSLSILTQDEREFLERYRWLCHVAEVFKPEELFSVMNNAEVRKEAEQKLRNFELGNGSVRCSDASILHALIPYVRRLVRLFPQIKENVGNGVYRYESQLRIEEIEQSALDFNGDALGVREFLTSDQQIWQLRMTDGDTWTGLSKVYRVFQKTCYTADCFSEGNHTVLKLKRLLKFNSMINLSALLASMETPHLLMIACETNQPVSDELRDMFKELFNILKQKKAMKIILTTQSEDSTSAFLQQIATETVGEGLKTTDEQLTWGDLTSTSQSKILEKEVIFQGRRVALNELTAAESVTHSFPLADLLKETELTIGEESIPSVCSGYNEKYYIDRTFHHNIFIRRDILTHKREGKFADLLASDEQEFKLLCQQNPTSNVHWLVKDKSRVLIWLQSQGNLRTLRNYIDSQKSHSYGPTDLDKLFEQARYQRVMLIADKAGMGKTTLLTHLSEQIKQNIPAHWLVRIDLNDYTEQLKAQKGKKMDKETVLEFVSKEVLHLESRLEKELFKKSFEGKETNKVVIMFDGFDEISPSYKEEVIDMLQVLKQTSVEQLWVTTRPHLREELEDKLQQLAYTLQPFSEGEQVEFLNKFWLQNPNLVATSQQRLEIYATALIRKLAQSISDKHKEFTGIPLQTRMLAEAFEEEFKSFYLSEISQPELPQKLELLGLYRRFIDSKYDIYYREKSKAPAGNVAAERQQEAYSKLIKLEHQQLALQALFTEDEVAGLQINYESTFSDEDLAGIGIAQRNRRGKPQFIHRTFAEYYVADFLINELTKKTKKYTQEQLILLHAVLLIEHFQGIRSFLDGLLEKSKPSKEALKAYGETLAKRCEWEERRRKGEPNITALHRAAREDNAKVIELLLDSLKSGQHSEPLKIMLFATDTEGRTAWHIAAGRGSADILQRLWRWEKEAQLKPDELSKLLLTEDEDGYTVWHAAAESGSSKALDALLTWAKEAQLKPDELNKLLLAVDKYGNTVLHAAIKSGTSETLQTLRSWAKEAQLKPDELSKLLLAVDNYENTVLHAAIKSGTSETLQTLRSWAKEAQLKPDELSKLLLAVDMDGSTVLHAAIKSGSLETLHTLWSWTKEAQLKPDESSKLFLAENKYGYTVLHAAAQSGSSEALVALRSWAEEAQLKPDELSKLLLAVDNYENTVLHAAIKSGTSETLQTLRSWAKEAQLKPDELSKLFLAENKYGYTVLHAAAQSSISEALVALWIWAKEAQLKPDELSKLLLAKDKDRYTALHAAAKSGSSEKLQTLFSWAKEAQLTPDELSKLLLAENKYGYTVLHAAAQSGSSEALQTLESWVKEAQLKPDEICKLLLEKNEYGETVWHAAAKSGSSEALLTLFSWAKEAQLKPDELSKLLLAVDKDGSTVLHAAAVSGSSEVLGALWSWAKEAQLKPDQLGKLFLAENNYAYTVLHAAAQSGSANALVALWSWGKEAQLKPDELSKLLLAEDEDGYTVLHAATKGGSSETLQTLFSWAKEAQLKPDELSKLLLAVDKCGNTVLHVAAESGSSELLGALFSWVKEAQLKPDELSKLLLAGNGCGFTVLHAAALSGSSGALGALWSWAKEAQLKPHELSKLLLAVDKYGNTVLDVAAESGSSELLGALWSCGKEAQLNPDQLSKLFGAADVDVNAEMYAAKERYGLELLQALRCWAMQAQLKPHELNSLQLSLRKDGKAMVYVGAESGSSEASGAVWGWAKEAQLKRDECNNLILVVDE